MKQYRDYSINTPEKAQLFIREWLPENSTKAVILHVHGLGEHSGRMDHWAERFNAKDIAFISYDQQGHGKSSGKRGFPKNFSQYLDDLHLLLTKTKEQFPDKPIILYGHSLGGNVVINYCQHYQNQPAALIATSPWLQLTKPPAAALLKLVTLLLNIAPGFRLSNGLNSNDISQVPEEVKKYDTDPLNHDRISIGLFNSTYQAGIKATQTKDKITCPFLLTHGTEDKITSPKASEEFSKIAGPNTQLKLWEGSFHELHHEAIREELFNYIIDWAKQEKLL